MTPQNNRTGPLANRLKEVFLNGRWIANTNYHEQLMDLNWQQATQNWASLNSPAQLTFHINYYLQGILSAFETGKLEIHDALRFQMPPIQNANHWNDLRQNLFNHAMAFSELVENLPDERLDQVFFEPQYGSVLRNIEACIEHAYYHLGQLVLIKKHLLQPQNQKTKP